MNRTLYFITHPNVVISREIPVPRWPLSERGFARMRAALDLPWIGGVTSVYCSDEQKAIDGADILAGHLALPITQIAELGENDRSATGFLPPDEFEKVADRFFANPDESVLGWERARDAQDRIANAVSRIIDSDQSPGSIAIVSHGGVGALLLCRLAGRPIDRQWDQPPNGGGNYFAISLPAREVLHDWKPIDG